jgi:hypothetical protein
MPIFLALEAIRQRFDADLICVFELLLQSVEDLSFGVAERVA